MALAFGASAQNFNPTVQITNTYEGRIMDVKKPESLMNIPDSVMHFDWQFDYSVFDNPFKGSYEFEPYLMEMRPEPKPYDGKAFYARLGAGYTLHPEALLVYNPKLKGRFSLGVYNDFKGYYGPYDRPCVTKGDEPFARLVVDRKVATPFTAYDLADKFGVNAGYAGKYVDLGVDAGYDLITTGQQRFRDGMFNSMNLGASVASKRGSRLDFNAAYRFRFGGERTDAESLSKFNEKVHAASAGVGYSVSDNLRASLDFNGRWLSDYFVSKGFKGRLYSNMDFIPGVQWRSGRFYAEGGVKVSFASGRCKDLPEAGDIADKGNYVYPQAYVSYGVIPDALKVFAQFRSGNDIRSFHELLEADHYLMPYFVRDLWVPGKVEELKTYLVDNQVERFNVSAGVQGRISSRFQYKADAGYAGYRNALLDRCFLKLPGYSEADDPAVPHYVGVDDLYPGMYRADYNVFYADLLLELTLQSFELSSKVRYEQMQFPGVDKETLDKGLGNYCLPRSPFTGEAKAVYNYNRRIFAGVSAEWATARQSEAPDVAFRSAYRVPGWVDLGVNFEYAISRKFSAWAKGGNLLGQTIQRSLLVAEKGPYFTLGVTFTL